MKYGLFRKYEITPQVIRVIRQLIDIMHLNAFFVAILTRGKNVHCSKEIIIIPPMVVIMHFNTSRFVPKATSDHFKQL